MESHLEIWKLAIGSAGIVGIFILVLTVSFKIGKFAKSFEMVDNRFESMEKRFDKIDRRMDSIESKIDNQSERLARIEGALWRNGTGGI